ncbi:uncharacterized protein LAJ45_03665 [Morchella importuna]|uniref:uncharacterized protein n=1 Tax=Morchella importuna TaxID=1174673 RepID=UPI001E8D73DD|nr:uncharacterized protein LAJ45_03665 [Morchella importuna]KAH8152239.1 hypothetical protein LAJ45_03665 [Morchella importuna]
MLDQNGNKRSPSPALEKVLAQYFPHIIDDYTDLQSQANGSRSRVWDASGRGFPVSCVLNQPTDYGPPTIPELDTTYFRFLGVETNTDVSLLRDLTSEDSDDSEYGHEQECSPQGGACEAGSHNPGQEGQYDSARPSLATANVALNALQLHSHDQAQFGISLYLHIPLNVTINIELDAGRQVKKSQASDHAHVSSSVHNDGCVYRDSAQISLRPGLIVGPEFSRPGTIGPDSQVPRRQSDLDQPFVLGPNAAMLEEHSDESTAAHTAYYGHNIPTLEARCPDGRFRCRVCVYTSGRLQALQRHIGTRTDNVRFSCPHCGKRFVRQDLMRIHSRKCSSNDTRMGPPDNAPGPRRGPRGSDGDSGTGASMSKTAKAKAARRRLERSGGKLGAKKGCEGLISPDLRDQ